MSIPANQSQMNSKIDQDVTGKTAFKSITPVILGTLLKLMISFIYSIFIPVSARGANSGVASLDSSGKVPTDQLPEGLGGGSSALFPNGWEFVTSDMLNEDGDFILSSEVVGKIVVIYLDRNVYPNTKVRLPEGFLDTDENLNSKNLGLIILDAGEWQKANGFPFIKSLTSGNAFNGGEGEVAGSTAGGELMQFVLLNYEENNSTILVPISTPVVYDNGIYKTANKFYYDNYTKNKDVSVIADVDSTYIVNNGSNTKTVLARASSMSVTVLLPTNPFDGQTITVKDYLCKSAMFPITIDGTDHSINTGEESVETDEISTNGGSKTYKFITDSGQWTLVNSANTNERIIDLGTVDYADLNTADPGSIANLYLGANPEGWYLEKIFVYTEDFSGGSVTVDSLVFSNGGALIDIPLTITHQSTIKNIEYDSNRLTDITDETENYIIVTMSATNTFDFTNGSVSVKALIKKYPN